MILTPSIQTRWPDNPSLRGQFQRLRLPVFIPHRLAALHRGDAAMRVHHVCMSVLADTKAASPLRSEATVP